MLEPKDKIALIGILATFVIAVTNLIYSIISNRRTIFVNTVTSSRLKWIESLRDKVSSFIAVTVQILTPEPAAKESREITPLLRERDTLMHQIILHLNPHDPEDQAIRQLIEQAVSLTSGNDSEGLRASLTALRNATQIYLKKEWTRVKRESNAGDLSGR